MAPQCKGPKAEPAVRCTGHMCPIQVHWHIKKSYREYWRVKMTVNNFNTLKNFSDWNLLVQHPGMQNLTKVFSFNHHPLVQYGTISRLILQGARAQADTQGVVVVRRAQWSCMWRSDAMRLHWIWQLRQWLRAPLVCGGSLHVVVREGAMKPRQPGSKARDHASSASWVRADRCECGGSGVFSLQHPYSFLHRHVSCKAEARNHDGS
ncbi:uncharacterized protein LOC119316375 isoform X1 [Triticum dicoccoides]|uniref:uncharacterized protein LOC119316375 isoform X1 n=1 Tax=Triticum dicoccoides TaxID=85692 RepID=UPI001891D29E|nr:uncharacterized protein LOC119316375 isoform X1 [Triticum dicoccoides]